MKMSSRDNLEKESHRRQEIDQKIREQKVAVDELLKLKKNRKVYVQQRNSNVFFLADRAQILASCKQDLDNMKKELQDI